MANVTVKSYRKERQKEILDGLMASMQQIGIIVGDEAKINATHAKDSGEHPAVQTGRLRASISYNWSRSGMERGKVESPAEASDGVSQPTEDIAVNIGTNVQYADIIEKGNSRQPPYPFLFPAVEAKRQEIIDLLKKSGGKGTTITEG